MLLIILPSTGQPPTPELPSPKQETLVYVNLVRGPLNNVSPRPCNAVDNWALSPSPHLWKTNVSTRGKPKPHLSRLVTIW